MDSNSFEKRMGLPERQFEVQRQTTNSFLRRAMWNWLYMVLWKAGIGHTTEAGRHRQYLTKFCQEFWVTVLNADVSEVTGFPPDVIGSRHYQFLQKQCLDGPWWFPYRLIEALLSYNQIFKPHLDSLKLILARYGSAYRLIEGRFIEITTDEQVQAVNAALEIATGPERAHLLRAIDFLGNRDHPDYRNSIKESISAVEACCRAIAGKRSATLADALKKIEGVHPVLSEAFKKLYGYTSDESGIRHALSEDDRVSHADAMFMLIACSAFISYLKQNAPDREAKGS